MSRRVHSWLRLFLSGTAALFAYTVVITSRPAAVAAPEKPRAVPRAAMETPPDWSKAAPASLPDPRQRFVRFGR